MQSLSSTTFNVHCMQHNVLPLCGLTSWYSCTYNAFAFYLQENLPSNNLVLTNCNNKNLWNPTSFLYTGNSTFGPFLIWTISSYKLRNGLCFTPSLSLSQKQTHVCQRQGLRGVLLLGNACKIGNISKHLLGDGVKGILGSSTCLSCQKEGKSCNNKL